ncbi:hypothetical protein [Opitutus terrae]|uniref:Tetratricopeptide TPR_4 n=1 Tax=Opitutus terrae (strain DSM 11246 / JCM 15787 / PB90-1) TaxID=452637 RepID=B1ZPC9_OPITP|nr:hypothetical protein [Opitutus terrae]ACB73534.1 Tetratricopeptide TPR_4 [Opitutus terrae PB90-1]
MRVRILLVLGLVTGLAALGAPAPLNPPAPLVARDTAGSSPTEAVVQLEAAQRAQEMGFSSIAVALYQELLQRPDADHSAAALGLATVWLAEGKPAEAEKVLVAMPEPHTAAWHLRKGLAAAQQNQTGTAKDERDASRVSELSPADRGWHLFLQGMIATAENEPDKATALFNQAIEAANSTMARGQFLLKREQARLRSGEQVTEERAQAMRRNFEQYQGRQLGYGFARAYAVMLDGLGRKSEAMALLQRQLVALPAEEKAEIDETRLLLGMIGGAAEGVGRNALERLLERGTDREKQRLALQLLASASTRPAQRTSLRRLLDTLVAAPQPHPILEDLLLYRAELALAEARTGSQPDGYAQAEDDVRTLLERFPGSPLKAHAYLVLTDAAWEQNRYRTAADNAAKAREQLPVTPGTAEARARLGLLIAEAWFRAGLKADASGSNGTADFRNAADAYQAVLREPPAGVSPGELMFQRVLTEIQAGTADDAAALLDELAKNPAFDTVNRWRAEWNLSRALQTRGQTSAAYARVNRLLATGGAAAAQLPVELRARMAWLQARLSSAVGEPERTLQLIDALAGQIGGASAELKTEIESSSQLLRSESNFALGRDAAALKILEQLRADYPQSSSAVYSYFLEAEHAAKQDRTADAQRLLTKLADEFPSDPYAPFALFQAALQAERRGQEENLKEANQLIEDLLALVAKYPHPESEQLAFAARLKQGDIFRKRNDFPSAQRAYENLVNNYSMRRDVVLAQLALAETLNAQAADEPALAESALVRFEHVRDMADAPVDARVEAGFNIGFMLARRGELAKAQESWWAEVVNKFLLDEPLARQLGDKGRFWMARTLLELGGLFEQQEKLEQAKEAWLLILKSKLGYGEALAKARLARFNLAEVTP